MMLSVMESANSTAQFISVLLIFIFVLALTLFSTRWIAKIQSAQNTNKNINIIETCRIASNKYIQVVKIGNTYMAIAIGKDNVTMLTEISEEELELNVEPNGSSFDFKDFLEKAKKLNSGKKN